jgi:hypothetical protein
VRPAAAAAAAAAAAIRVKGKQSERHPTAHFVAGQTNLVKYDWSNIAQIMV